MLSYITEEQIVDNNVDTIKIIIDNIGDIPNKENLLLQELHEIYRNIQNRNFTTYFYSAILKDPVIHLLLNDYKITFEFIEELLNIFDKFKGRNINLSFIMLCYPDLFTMKNIYSNKKFKELTFEITDISIDTSSVNFIKLKNKIDSRHRFVDINNKQRRYFIDEFLNANHIKVNKLRVSEKIILLKMNYHYWNRVIPNFKITKEKTQDLLKTYALKYRKKYINETDYRNLIEHFLSVWIKDLDLFSFFKDFYGEGEYGKNDFNKNAYEIIHEILLRNHSNDFYDTINRLFKNNTIPNFFLYCSDSIITKIDYNKVKFYTQAMYKRLLKIRPILIETASEHIIISLSLDDWRQILSKDIRYGMVLLKHKKRSDTFDKMMVEFPKLRYEVLYVD